MLVRELIVDAEGDVAPRLGDVTMSEQQALEDHSLMMTYVMRMLCAGIIHGDLSEFNVLMDQYGPVIIDLPQAVDAAANNHAKSMLLRDVANMSNYFGLFAPQILESHYAQEMWALYESGKLDTDTVLSGNFQLDSHSADVDSVMDEIKAIITEENDRLERLSELAEQ